MRAAAVATHHARRSLRLARSATVTSKLTDLATASSILESGAFFQSIIQPHASCIGIRDRRGSPMQRPSARNTATGSASTTRGSPVPSVYFPCLFRTQSKYTRHLVAEVDQPRQCALCESASVDGLRAAPPSAAVAFDDAAEGATGAGSAMIS